MRVALDVDGLVANFAEPCNHWLASRLGVEPEPIDRWDWFRNYDAKVGAERVDKMWKQFWKMAEDSPFFSNLPVMHGAQQGVRDLLFAGHDLFFLTARNQKYWLHTRAWLDRHGFEDIALVMDRDKSGHDYQLLVDDKPGNVLDAGRAGKRAVLFRRPWNVQSNVAPQAADWASVVRMAAVLQGRLVNA